MIQQLDSAAVPWQSQLAKDSLHWWQGQNSCVTIGAAYLISHGTSGVLPRVKEHLLIDLSDTNQTNKLISIALID